MADTSAISGGSGIYYAIGGAPEPKKLTEVFKTVDNETVIDVSYISTLIGKEWATLYLNGSKNSVTWTEYAGTVVDRTSTKEHTIITDFLGGDDFGFAPISAKYVELKYNADVNKPVLYAGLSAKSLTDAAGVATEEVTLESLKKAGYLCVVSKVDSTTESVRLSIRLSGYDKSGKELVYVADSYVGANKWNETYVDIKSFIKDVDSETLTLSIVAKPSGNASDVQGLWISRISSEAPDKTGFPFWIIWVVLGLAAVGGMTAFVIWFRKNYTFVRE